jgi:DNA-binding response OmpR family regulator
MNTYSWISAINCPVAMPNQPFYRDEHLYVDLRQQLVILDSETVTLTRMEYRLLALLVQHAGEIVCRATIMTQVWGYAPEKRTRTVDIHIGRLRKKLRKNVGTYIETIFDMGYRFRPAVPPSD